MGEGALTPGPQGQGVRSHPPKPSTSCIAYVIKLSYCAV